MADEGPATSPASAQPVSRVAAGSRNVSPLLRPPQPATTTADSTEPAPTMAETNGDAASPDAKEEDSETPVADAKPHGLVAHGEDVAEAKSASAEPASDGTPKDKKKKPVGGVPEHKNKKLGRKKSMITLRLDCKPGEYYWARLKGYPPWPAIVCDEEMLPESLLATRPVSTARPDGSLRDDFKEGGKNAKERTFPIMFLHTNEFQWMVNTSLTPLTPEECKTLPKAKMTKALVEAYKVAAEGHDIDYFKDLLRLHQQELESYLQQQAEDEERRAAEADAKAAAAENGEAVPKEKKKKGPRKSKAADEDVDMEDADAPKSTKKRKKADESDADAKPKKTPKVTKLNGPKTPNGDASTAKKPKPKKKVVSAPKSNEEEKPQMTHEERLAQREKAVLYLRHRLQKGFLSRDQAPKEDEMASMAEFFTQLEGYENLEPAIIRLTKIHKVLKAIVKLASLPKDDEFNFKKRSSAMLEIWNKRLEADGDPQAGAGDKEKSAAPAEAPASNGEASAPSATESNEKPAGEDKAAEEATKEIAAAGTTKAEAEEGAAKPIEGQEIEMQDAEASETPAKTEIEKVADSNAGQIEEKVEAVKLDEAAAASS
ncbi:hypothetical protein CERZMDRAFT_80456 [Cercospora zeae-maydis SCOH1-5]|uniref:PWWP domain-containing protein n=1 Tax=Cercospora zeae-maydis SCOH1-5 TaxID=717836 RepID=A0A6A6FWG5_9PEZI|nr:hypothetical protein CERZMDRAFT_80456 [Cercospora zeae-maydis SCOH1-5]